MSPDPQSKADLAEIQFCMFLDERYCEDVTQGDTTREIRMWRARRLIERMGDADKPDGKGRTIRDAFAAVYGEALAPIHHHENNDGV
jgi:hypothetical protein